MCPCVCGHDDRKEKRSSVDRPMRKGAAFSWGFFRFADFTLSRSTELLSAPVSVPQPVMAARFVRLAPSFARARASPLAARRLAFSARGYATQSEHQVRQKITGDTSERLCLLLYILVFFA